MIYRIGLCQMALGMLILLTGCTTQPIVQYVQSAIPVPPLPHIPTLTEEQESSMRDDVYEAVENRDNAKTYYIDQVQRVLCSTHPDPKACFEEYSLK